MKRYAFIYNPAAGRGKSKARIASLEQQIQQLPKAQLFRSELKGDIANLVGQIIDDFDVFVACGGDGTVREIASQLISTDKTMGIIPMGTGNDLCKTLEIPTDIKQAFKIICNGKTREIDVGRCNKHIFLNSMGFGFDGLTNRYASELQNYPAFLRYAIAALKATFNHSPFKLHIKTNNRTLDQNLIMATFANGRVEGNTFWIAPGASITDGRLNLIMITPVSRWKIPLLLPFIIFKKPDWLPQVKSIEVVAVELSFRDNVEIHADGEIINMNNKNISISLIPKGLEIIAGCNST